MFSKLKRSRYYSTYILSLMIAIGIATAYIHQLALLFGAGAFIYGAYATLIKRNRNGEAHLYAAFIMASEVYLRMSHVGLPWEFGKITVSFLLLLGMVVEKQKRAIPLIFFLYLLMLLPGVFVPEWTDIMQFKSEFMFTFLGQVVLVISVFYFYKRTMTLEQWVKVGQMILWGVVLTSALLFVKTPDYATIHYGGGSNFAASGGFGPNQLVAILGMGIMLLGYFLLINKRLLTWKWLEIVLLFLFTYQGLFTFSRGGLFSAVIALSVAVIAIYIAEPKRASRLLRINPLKIFLLIVVLGVAYTQANRITGGALEKRYTNVDEYGQKIKKDYSTNRITIVQDDLHTFSENLFTGAGIGGGRAYRAQNTGISAAHVEFSRMLAEHGILGLFALAILLFYPVFMFFKIKNTFSRFTMVVFVLYGLLTMSHNALRLAMPSFLYGLGFVMILVENKSSRLRKGNVG